MKEPEARKILAQLLRTCRENRFFFEVTESSLPTLKLIELSVKIKVG